MPKAINLQSAQRLMQITTDPDFDRKINEMKRTGDIDLSLTESAPMSNLSNIPAKGTYQYQEAVANTPRQINPANLSKFPKAIQESFMQNPGMMGDQIPDSVYGFADIDKLFGGNIPKMPVNENKTVQNNIAPLNAKQNFSLPQINEVKNNYQAPQPTYQSQSVPSAGIDYSVLRAILVDVVNQALDEKLKNIGVLDGLTVGKTFKFFTKEGELYEAKLEHKGNIKDIKK